MELISGAKAKTVTGAVKDRASAFGDAQSDSLTPERRGHRSGGGDSFPRTLREKANARCVASTRFCGTNVQPD
jgi:hypothetical protein